MRLYVRNNSLLFRCIDMLVCRGFGEIEHELMRPGGQGQLLCLFLCIIRTL